VRRYVSSALALLTLFWLVLLVSAPTVASGVRVSTITYTLGALVCHQQPERSFHVAGTQFPVCARCMGLYVGAFAGAWFAALHRSTRGTFAVGRVRSLVVLAAIPTAFTLCIELLGLASPSNVIRAVAALPLGAAVAWAVTLNYDECAQPQQTAYRRPPILF
jgi:uncharacterized membrane protein